MDNRTLLAVILSIFVIIGYQYFFSAQQPQVKEEKPPVEKKEETARPLAAPAVAETAPAEEKGIRVENELYTAILSSRGGTIKYWEIKEYKDKIGKDVILLKKPGIVPALGIGSNNNFDLADVNFNVSGRDMKLDGNNRSGTIIFEYYGDGISVRRTYTFYSGTYKVDVADEVSGLPEYWITLGSDFGIFENEDSYTHVGPVLLTDSNLEELKPKKLNEPKIFRENLKWIAQEDKYFFSALVPQTPVEEAKAWLKDNSPVIAFKGKTDINKFSIYAGPKDSDRLSRLNLGLEHIINFGFFSVIARPLFWVLKFFYGFLGNYGWAIILLTIVTRIPFIPLMNKGQKSMKKLQAIQPKMAEVREKYKKDPQKMQKEMTELYKKHKVNPVSGCLPMLLQIPVFFALYKVLLIAIELRGAPFMLWITDLSVKDPYYILPVVMGITMVIQQKMTPSGMDPKQAKLMMLMPVIFTFLFLNFASGLVLYWLVNNVLSIIQQFFTNRKLAKEAL
ncbi:MAG: membrane protein insertase YidC [Nitrospirota bacterium]